MTQTSEDKQSISKEVKPFFDNLPRGVKAFLLTSITWTALPLFVVIWDGSNDPFMFAAAFSFGEAIFGVLYLFAFHRELLKWEKIKSFLPTRKTLFGKLQETKNNDPPRWNWVIILTIPKATVALYAWSTAYIPDLVATVLLDLFGVPMMLLLMPIFEDLYIDKRSSKSSDKDSKPNDKNPNSTARKIALIFFIIFGAILVVLSGNSGATKNLSPFNRETLIGLMLIVFAVANSKMGRPIYEWSRVLSDLKESKNTPDTTKETTKNMSIAYFIFMTSLSGLITGIIGLVITSFTSNSIGWTNFWIVLGVGTVFGCLGSKANVSKNLSKTQDKNKTGIISLTPAISAIYLWVFSYILAGSYIDDVRPDIFILGLCAIVVGNILLRLAPEVRFGLASLVIGIWVSGYIVLFRDNQLDDWFPDATWIAPPETYFAVLALSATAFTLLLAFRISRITSRSSEEEKLVYSLLARFNFISSNTQKISNNIDNLKMLDAPKNQGELEETYVKISNQIKDELRILDSGSTIDNDNKEYKKYLLETHAELDILARSKQYGQEYGEKIAIVFLGFLTFAITLITRPEADDLIGFIFDSFGFIFAGVIVFLTMFIFDLHRERTNSSIKKIDKNGDKEWHRVEFIESGDRIEWIVSILVTVVLVIVLCYLIGAKWF